MERALVLARRAAVASEVPVGALLVRDGEVLGEGWNHSVAASDPTAHAEILALRAAGAAAGSYRLVNTTLYVTLEPCGMCAVAMVHARVQRLVFGAFDPKTGAAGSVFELVDSARHNHRIRITGGVLADRSAALLQAFFAERR